MAQVLSPPSSDSPFGSRPLSRNTSQASLVYCHPDHQPSIPSTVAFSAPCEPLDGKPAASIPSSAPSSPRLASRDDYASSQPSLLSTPSSSLSLDEEYCAHDDDDIAFLNYATEKSTPSQTPPPKEASLETTPVNTARRKIKSAPSFEDMPEVPLRPNPSFISMGDDATVEKEPSRHVDYLSHAWREEDIWCSWRHIVARRGALDNGERLENASWRTWAKTQRRLKTVSPETLNWMKDHDVTWLYGPLQTVDPNAFNPDSPTARSRLSRTNSFGIMKPILKRRNISEAMLQRSLSNSTLVRQAVACITSQESSPGGIYSPVSLRFHDQVATPAPSPHESSTDYFSPSHSGSTSVSLDPTTPGTERRHIHFNNKVEQCIAVDQAAEDAEENYAIDDADDDSDDDGIIIMQTGTGKERKLSQVGGTPRNSFSTEQTKTTIAMLPATTLKYRGDTPEPPDRSATPRPPSSSGWGDAARKLSHSSSSETLKPSRPSNNFLIDDDDDDDPDVGWQPTSYSPGGIPLDYYNDDEDDAELEARGMRRTPSGMFMPYDDDEDVGNEESGIFGRVVDTVNTARDIAHVIWNVGWRR